MNKINIFLVIVILLLCGALWKERPIKILPNEYECGVITTQPCTVTAWQPLGSNISANKMEQGDIMMTDVHCDDQGTGACLCPMYQKEINQGTLKIWDEDAMNYCVDNGLVNFM